MSRLWNTVTSWLESKMISFACTIDPAVFWINRHVLWFKRGLGITFLVFMCLANNYLAVAITGLVAGTVYSLLVGIIYVRDRNHLRKAPVRRLRFFFGLPSGECLVCHEEVKDPMLLSCGHTYCADCLRPLINKKKKKSRNPHCAYCGQTPDAAHSLRVERIATMQLALGITQALDFGLKCLVGGWLNASLVSLYNPQFAIKVFLDVPMCCWIYGCEFWWKGHRGDAARRAERKQLPEKLRWTQDVRDQMQDGWDWKELLRALPIAVGWTAMWACVESDAKRTRQHEAFAQCQQVCPCGVAVAEPAMCPI